MVKVQTGLVRLLDSPPPWLQHKRLGLLCNPASVDHRLKHARELIQARFPDQLVALYAPQHGFYAEKQDNMIESPDMVDPELGLPVYSLYAHTRIPTEDMLASIDVLLVDLQDVGTRVYTFIYTLSYCMEAAGKHHKRVLVLDRPNPIGGTAVEGNCLAPEWSSFVGRFPLPMRHGLTIGELALLFRGCYQIECDLEVMPMAGWQRDMLFDQTGLPWVAPSPNLPTTASAAVYPGQVIWEGTNVSEGRGTTQPFELFGAPFIEPRRILTALGQAALPGIILRPTVFEPTSNKWQGQPCRGFQLHMTDPQSYRPYETSLKLLSAVIKSHPEHFAWKQPPYEYEHERLPIDLIIGEQNLRKRIEALHSIESLAASWQSELDRFVDLSRPFMLY